MLFACLVSLFDMLNPKIITFTVDSILGDAKASVPSFMSRFFENGSVIPYLKTHLYMIALVVAVIALFAALFRYLFKVFNAMAAETLVKRMRDTLYEHIQHLPVSWHTMNSTGDIIQRCTSDVETIKVFLSERLTMLIRMLVLIVMAVVFMAGINPRMTVFASLFIPVVVGYSLVFHTKIGNAFEKADIEEGLLSAIAQENLTGVRVVRAFGREMYERERFEKQNKVYTGYWIRLIRILSFYWSSGDLLTGAQLLLVTVMGAYFCVHGQITAGEYIAFVSYNAMLTWPVRAMGRVISEMSKSGISVERLRYIMNSEREALPENPLTPPVDRDIVFSHVSFRYPEVPGSQPEKEAAGADSSDSRSSLPAEKNDPDPWVLRDISVRIPAGSVIGIIGTTGSGKSTLVSLLLKLWPLAPENGTITIGGVDINDIDSHYLRTRIGLVLQEPFLFSKTLGENIRISAPEAERKELLRAVRIADLEETVNRFPSGYDTAVGERGVTLSGGQKQRTAMAQMLIRRTPVMIFDDSLSAVDSETDVRIRTALRSETAGSTVILIAHRITTVMHADRIIVMDRGRIAEAGTHEELLETGGIYRRIYDLQMADGEEA